MALKRLLAAVVLALLGFGMFGAGGIGQARAQESFKQLKLTEKMVQGFIAAQTDLVELAKKAPPPANDKPDPKIQAELDAIAKKHGFANFAEFDDVAFNISFVMTGIEPQTGAFTDQVTLIQKEIDEVKADKTVPDDQKKQMLDDLAEALKNTPALQFPENVEIVKKYRADIAKVLN